MGPGSPDFDLELQHALAARFDPAVGRLAEHGHVAVQELRGGRGDRQQSVVLSSHLLARVEHVGDIDGRLDQAGGQFEHDRQAAFHVGAPQPPKGVAVQPGCLVAVGGHGVEMPGQHDSRAPPEIRSGRRRWRRCRSTRRADPAPQHRLHPIGEGRLVVAHGRDRHQLGGRPQQIRRRAQRVPPCWRRMSLRRDLSWRSPGSRRLITRAHASPNSPPG